MGDSVFERGMKTRRRVLGDDHVNAAQEATTEFDADFQKFITEGAWGSVWSRPGLDPATRSLLTISILASLGRTEELVMHLRASRNTGTDPQAISEALLHVAVYAGVPAANSAFKLAKKELGSSESDEDGEA